MRGLFLCPNPYLSEVIYHSMKFLATLSLFFVSITSSFAQNKVETKSLNGAWIPVRQELGGQALPSTSIKIKLLQINANNYSTLGELVDKGTITYKDGKLDVTGVSGINAGKHFTALYQLEGDKLTIIYNLEGTNYPESYETDGKPMYLYAVYKRQPAQN